MSSLPLGNGAIFWAYVSPHNDTASKVTDWSVSIEQEEGNWKGTITSDDPREQLQTPGLSGVFQVTVIGSGPDMRKQQLQPGPDCKPDIGCNSNCAAMVTIVANDQGTSATYCTTWDAMCSRKPH